jgi:hypothetical protein
MSEICCICGRSDDEIELKLVVCVCVDHMDCGSSRGEFICVECDEEDETPDTGIDSMNDSEYWAEMGDPSEEDSETTK